MRDEIPIKEFAGDERKEAERLVLTLYVAAAAPNSRLAESNLRRLLSGAGIDYSLQVVDCLTDPLRALRDGVLVTPTLVKVSPEPQQTVIGTLQDANRLAAILGIEAPSERSRTHA